MCKVKAKLGRRRVLLQTIGYRGKKEAKTPLADARQARAFIVPKKDAKGLKIGSTRTVVVAGKKIKCTVKKWSRGSRLLLPKSQYPLKNISPKRLKAVVVT